MIKHIVMWRIKEAGADPGHAGNIKELIARLESLKTKIPQVLNLEVGVDINRSEAAADVVLYSEFENRADLEFYQKHPDHLKVAEFLKRVALERRVVDYEV